MELLDKIVLHSATGARTIELLQGDLAALPPEHAVDVLVVSAFPGGYVPTHSSVIGALWNRGVNVTALARSKSEDLREDFGCWLSETIPGSYGFRRILCFEPLRRGTAPEVVGDLFRAIAALAGSVAVMRSVAMPILASGDQGHDRLSMLKSLLAAAREWMEQDIPLSTLKIVTLRRTASLLEVFTEFKTMCSRAEAGDERTDCDVFISAAPEDANAAELVTRVVSTVSPELRIYRSVQSQPNIAGMLEQHYAALDSCRRVMALLTPAFMSSKVCQEDLCVARFRSHRSPAPVLFPVYLRDATLPPSIRVLRMIDCREFNASSLRVASALLAIQLRGIHTVGDSFLVADPHGATLPAEQLGHLLGVPVIGQSRRHVDVGAPGSVSREAVLLEFCLSAFSAEEFRIFLRHLPDGQSLVADLPNPGMVSATAYCDRALEALTRREMIDERFFAEIRRLRARRIPDIDQVAALWDTVSAGSIHAPSAFHS
jgi:hypothetical protein